MLPVQSLDRNIALDILVLNMIHGEIVTNNGYLLLIILSIQETAACVVSVLCQNVKIDAEIQRTNRLIQDKNDRLEQGQDLRNAIESSLFAVFEHEVLSLRAGRKTLCNAL